MPRAAQRAEVSDDDRGILKRRGWRLSEPPCQPAGRVPAAARRILQRDERCQFERFGERDGAHHPGVRAVHG